MLIAGSVDMQQTLGVLALLRPVFHSEADFQFAFAWQVQQRDPAMLVRLETRPTRGVHLDLAFTRLDLGRTSAVEVKYLTRSWIGEFGGEQYTLKNQGAQDIRAYDVVKDIVRVERFVDGHPGVGGAVVVITNDQSYWQPAKPTDTSNAAAFRITEGTVLTGPRAWGPNTGPGTMKGRIDALCLCGRYEMRWADYSRLHGGGHGAELRRLVIEVSSALPS